VAFRFCFFLQVIFHTVKETYSCVQTDLYIKKSFVFVVINACPKQFSNWQIHESFHLDIQVERQIFKFHDILIIYCLLLYCFNYIS
jgi:hypothetical protein